MSLSQRFQLCFTADDKRENPYRLVPVEVPEGIVQLEVRYQVADAQDPEKTGKGSGSTVDLGLFDPRGHAFLDAAGFRGWSGAARDRAILGPVEATPGYLPGPIQAGTWHVVLGLAEMAPQGCEVTLVVEMTPGAAEGRPTPTPSYEPPGVLRREKRWYRGDLHCHTHHSDATAGVSTLVPVARAQGLDFLAITDHNTVSHLPDLAREASPDLLLIPAVEVSTYRGHANVYGVRSWVEFRAQTEGEMRRIREQVRDRGMLFSVNHPKEGGPAWAFASAVDADAVEGWQAPWWLSNYQSLAFWDRLLCSGERPTLIGGSDKHQGAFDGTLGLYEIGTPTTWVLAPALSEAAILDGIRAGHVFVSQDPAGPRLAFSAEAAGQEAMMGDVLHVRAGERIDFRCQVDGADEGWLLRVVCREGEAACVPVEGEAWTHAWWAVVKGDDYWRVEVIEPPDEPLDQEPAALFASALSNPIYVRTVP